MFSLGFTSYYESELVQAMLRFGSLYQQILSVEKYHFKFISKHMVRCISSKKKLLWAWWLARLS